MQISARRSHVSRRTLAVIRSHHGTSHRLATRAVHRAWIDLKAAIAADDAARGDWMNDIPGTPRAIGIPSHHLAARALHSAELVAGA